MELTSSIAKNTGIQIAGKIISVGLGWAIVLLMTNALGVVGFGEYTIMTAYLQFFGVAADFGLVLVSSQLLAERAAERERIFNNLFTFRLLSAAVILALAPLFIWLFPYSTVVKQGVVILVLSYLISALLQVYTGLNQARLTMGRVVVGEILSRLVLIIFIVWAIMSGQGLLTMLVGVVIGAAANLLWLGWKSQGIIKLRLEFDKSLWLIIWQRSWPLIATILLNLIYLKADTIILSLTRSAAEVGVYGAVYRVFEVLITFPTMFASLLVPIISAARLRGDVPAMKQLATRGYEIIVVAILPMLVTTMFFAQHVVKLFGEDFLVDGPALLKLLVIANALVFVGTYFAHLVVAGDQQKKMIMPFAATAVVAMTGYLIFIPMFGAYGAATMTIVAEALIAILAYRVLRSSTVMGVELFAPLFKSTLAILPMVVLLLGGLLPILASASIGLALYVVLLIIMDGLPKLSDEVVKII